MIREGVKISEQLKDCSFIRVNKNSKIPYTEFKGDDWNNKIINYDEANQFIKEGWNVGLVAKDGYIIIDADSQESVDWCDNNLPKTYIEETCSKGKHYVYRIEETLENLRIPNDMGEVRCNRQFVVCSPSRAESKITKTIEDYKVVDNSSIAIINKDMIEQLMNYFKKINPRELKKIEQKNVSKEFLEENIIPKLSNFMKDLVSKSRTKEELQKLGYPSRSERDMKVVSHLLNKGFGEYVFSIFKFMGCGDKYREHTSGEAYLNKTIEESIRFLGLRSVEDTELEFEIETLNETWLKRKVDTYLLKIDSIKDNKDLFKERLITTLAYRTKLKQNKLEKRLHELVENSKPKEVISLLNITTKEFKEQKFWIEPILPKNMIIMLGSKPGEGKSLFVQAMITSLLTTNQFLGYQSTEQPKVLLYSIDDSSENILNSRSYYLTNGLKDKKTFDLKKLENCKITFQFNNTNLAKEVEESMNYDIIIIDSYRRVLSGGENDSETTDEFFKKYLNPLKEAGKTILILHHLKKGNLEELNPEDFLDALRGSGDIGAQLDLCYALKSMPTISLSPMHEIKDNILYICKNRLGVRFRTLEGSFTNQLSYRIIKESDTRTTEFEYLDPSRVKSPKERRQEAIIKIVKTIPFPSRANIVRELKKDIQCSDVQIFKDLEDLVKSFILTKPTKGVYRVNMDLTCSDESESTQFEENQNI
jgi:archaellum biogenesis ATPase FlaH